MKLEKFTIKDIVFIAILAAAITLSGMITMPLVMSITLFGLRNMVSAIFYSLFTAIALLKVKKIGTLTLIGFFHASVLLMMAPVMFFTIFLGAFLAELICFFIFKSYHKKGSIEFASTLFIPMTIPFTLIFTMAIHGKDLSEIIERPLISIFIFITTIILSYIGMTLGIKISDELRRAGKL